MPNLSSAALKLERANEYLTLFNEELAIFLKRDPYKLIPNGESEEGAPRFIIKIYEPPPPRLALYVGGFAHYLRCTIEHTAWQLALLTTDSPSVRTAFPIYCDRALYLKESPTKLKDILPAAHSDIEQIQPYNTRNDSDPLWQILIFSDVDKHRDLAIVQTSFRAHVHVGDGHRLGFLFTGTFSDGNELTIQAVSSPAADEMDLKVDPVFSIIAQKGRFGAHASVDGLKPIYEFIRDDFMPRFGRFFG